MPASDALDWTALKPFGATVRMDLRGEVSERQVAELRALFDRMHLLHFPDQSLTNEDQRRVARWFGPVPASNEVARYATDTGMGDLGSGELVYHSDLSCTPEPLLGISLHAIEVEERSSTTCFVDAMAVVRDMPLPMRSRLERLHVMNLWPMELGGRQRSENAPEGWPGTVHPLLKQHPRTGDPILYVNANHSDRIIELPSEESESLILEMFERLYDPANCYEHRWCNGDLVVWDNLALQHSRKKVPPGVPRTLQRVEIGTADYMELMPPALKSAYGIG